MRSGSRSTAAAGPIRSRSARIFRDPIAEFQVFPYFAAFVAVFFRFAWPVIDLSEGVFGVANYVRDYVECLRHGSDPFFIHTRNRFQRKECQPPWKIPMLSF